MTNSKLPSSQDTAILWFIAGFFISYTTGILYLLTTSFSPLKAGLYGATAGAACGLVRDLIKHDPETYDAIVPTSIGAIVSSVLIYFLMS